MVEKSGCKWYNEYIGAVWYNGKNVLSFSARKIVICGGKLKDGFRYR